jgi:hypothetical protein
MRRSLCWAAVAFLVATAVGVGVGAAGEKRLGWVVLEPAPLVATRPADPKVAQLIADLGSEDYRAREKAGRELAALGEKALPDMRAALLAAEQPEVQRRLTVLVRKMDHDRLVSPKKVTLAARDRTPKDALAEIEKQTGYKIDYSGPGGAGETKHRFEFDNAPFWEAVDKVAAATGCVVYADSDDNTVRVFNQDAMNPYVAYAGPFRFLAQSVHSNRSVQLAGISRRGGGSNRHENLNLSFQIHSEPKNPMLGVTQAEVVSAVDESGASLVPPRNPDNRNRSNYYESRGNRGHNVHGNVQLARPDKSATTIKSLKGKIGIVLLTGTVPEVVVADPLKVKTKTFSGRTVEVDFASLVEDANNKGHYVLDLTVKKQGVADPDRDDYNWANSIWQKVEVADAAGNKYQSSGPNNVNYNGASVQLTIPYGTTDRRTGKAIKLGPPAKVVVNEWLTVTHEVTFDFKDVPLP